MNIFQIIAIFGNLIPQIEAIVATGATVTVAQIESLVETALIDLGKLIPKDAPLFQAIVATLQTIPAIIAEAGKLTPPKQ